MWWMDGGVTGDLSDGFSLNLNNLHLFNTRSFDFAVLRIVGLSSGDFQVAGGEVAIIDDSCGHEMGWSLVCIPQLTNPDD
jgi:hypothetical protein